MSHLGSVSASAAGPHLRTAPAPLQALPGYLREGLPSSSEPTGVVSDLSSPEGVSEILVAGLPFALQSARHFPLQHIAGSCFPCPRLRAEETRGPKRLNRVSKAAQKFGDHGDPSVSFSTPKRMAFAKYL